MPHKNNNPGCPCCCEMDCETFSDSYTQNGRDPLPTDDYIVQVPYWDWLYASNRIYPAAAGAMYLYKHATQPAQVLRCWWGYLGSMTSMRFVHNFLNKNNYAYAQIATAAAYVANCEIYRVVSGVASKVAGPTSLDMTPGLVWVSYLDGYLQVLGGATGFVTGNVGDSGGTYCGVESTSSTKNAANSIDIFDHAGCISAAAHQGRATMAYDVTITGTASHDGTHRVWLSGAPAQNPTTYVGTNNWWVELQYAAGTTTIIVRQSNNSIRYRKVVNGCMTFDGLNNYDVPWWSGTDPGSTCELSAVK